MMEFNKDALKAIEINEIQKLEELKNKTVLVTGGTGFLGLWIAETIKVLNENFNFNTNLLLLSRETSKVKTKAPHLWNYGKVKFIDKDVRDIFELPNEIDYLIHAAGDPDTRNHSSNPLNVIETITKGTDNVISSALRINGIKKILHISSGLVTGVRDINANPIKENSYVGIDTTSISNVYVEAKRMSEVIAFSYRSLYKLPIVVARPFTFIGPYQSMEKPWAVNHFIREASNGGPIRILGNGKTIRSFIYGADAASWMLKLLVKGVSGQAYNVAGKESVSMRELSEKVKSAVNKNVEISYDSINDSLPANMFLADLNQSMQIGLKHSISIDEGISKTIKWCLEGKGK